MRRTALLGGIAAALLLAAGAWHLTRPAATPGVTRDRHGDLEQTVPAGGLPVFARGEAEPAYRFAASEAGRILEGIPCFCGCGDIGHASNRACYVKAQTAAATTFTSHGGG